MAEITLGGNPVRTTGNLPAVGTPLPELSLVRSDLTPMASSDLAGSTTVLNIFPSVDTGVCAASVRGFNERAASLDGVRVVNVSADLPFAQARFCGAEGIDRVEMASAFRNPEALEALGVRLVDGTFEGLAARAVLVVDAEGTVTHSQLVPEIGQEPDYDAALAAL